MIYGVDMCPERDLPIVAPSFFSEEKKQKTFVCLFRRLLTVFCRG